MKVIVTFSGGKDSLAALLWTRKHITKNFTTVFCDTGWEHPQTYEYINRIADKLHLDLVTLKSKKYDGMVDLARQKKRWPSTRARFCTQELKTKPCIDYVLDEVQDNMLMIQGIRAAESASRAKMSAQCTYFKYYFEPYGYDKNGKPKKHTYRGKEVRAFREKFADDLLRPVFDWSAQQVIDYILAAGLEPNPLYKMGYKRVGCWPCVMANQRDILNIARQSPERIDEIATLEQELPGTALGSDPLCKVLLDYEVDPATVGQYTGLKDKNGKEVWEGDIIPYKSYAAGRRWWRTTEEIPEIEREVQQQRDEYVTKRGVCEYSDGYFSVDGIFLFYVKVGERIRTYKCTSCDVEERQWDFEVIGNIHDTPELLKTE